MLGLRLDEPVPLDGLEAAVDPIGLERMVAGGLAVVDGTSDPDGGPFLSLTRRGRFLGGGVTSELLA